MSKILLRYEKLFFSDNQYQAVSLLAIILFVCSVFFDFTILGLVMLLIFPSSLLINYKLKSILLVFPLATGLNMLFVVVAMVILDLVGLPISIYSAITVTFIISVVVILINIRYKRKLFSSLTNTKSNLAMVPIYILFGLGLLSRLMSVIDAQVPIAHDPEAHAFWTKRIINEQAINYFYSPGLHIWASFISFAADLSIAKTINVLTNFLSSFSILLWGLATYAITKNKVTSTFVAFLVLIIPMPANVYFLAGKNSLIAVLPFFGLLFIFNNLHFSEKRSLSNAIGLGFVLAGIAAIHYPSFVYAATFTLLCWLYMILIQNKFSFDRKLIISNTLWITPLVVSLLFTFSFVYKTYSTSPKIPIIANKESGASYHEKSAINGPADSSSLQTQNGRIVDTIDIKNPKNSIPSFMGNMAKFVSRTSGKLGLVILGATLIAWYFLLNILSKKTLNSKPLALTAIIVGASLFLTMGFLNIFVIKALGIVESTGYFLILIFSTLILAELLSHLTKVSFRILSVIVIIVGAYSSISVYKTFQARASTALVNDSDISAFNWINENHINDTGFIGTSTISPSRKHVVFPNDGSTWLPVFTNNHISTPFHDQGFLAINSHINYEYTLLLSSADETKQRLALRYYKSKGFEYLYIDGDKARTSLSTDSLINDGLLKIIYQNDEVSIGKLRI